MSQTGNRKSSNSKLVGRGATYNPKNRFETIEIQKEPGFSDSEEEEEPGGPETTFLKDSSQSAITHNTSPDIGFDASLNPYRGCEHGCAYCLSGDTPILMDNGSTLPLEKLAVADEIYGTRRDGWYRRYTKTTVLAHWRVEKPAYRITLEDGRYLVASGDHRFLTERGWRSVSGAGGGEGKGPSLTPNDRLVGMGGSSLFPRELPDLTRAVRVHSTLGQHPRSSSDAGTAISQRHNIEGVAVESGERLRVASIEALPRMELYDITTTTGDFIANGVVSHNCYARPTHEYLGLSAGLDFESKIMVKENAPRLLRKELSSPKWEPKPLALSGVTDPYQPIERRLGITRSCLEVLAEFKNPVVVITKNHLVSRDADLLGELARHNAAAVFVSLTTLDDGVRRVMEPRTSPPSRRLSAIEALAGASVPVGVMVAPLIPGLTDHELPDILSQASRAGASFASYTPVRLPGAVAPLFQQWLSEHFPDRKEKVLNRIRGLRGGKLNDPRFGSRMRGGGVLADHLGELFSLGCRRAGIEEGCMPSLSTESFRRSTGGANQPTLFDR